MKPARLLLSFTGILAASVAGYFLMAEASPQQLTDLRDDYRFAFARSFDAQKVVAIDTHNQTKVAEIDFPHKVGDILVSKMLDMLFVNDPENNAVTPVFLKDLSLAPGFAIGFTPVQSILGPEDQFAAFVGAEGELLVFDLENIRPIYQNAGFQPGARIAFSASGHDILVVEGERNQLLAINLEAGKIVGVADLTLKAGTRDISAVTRSLDGHTGFIAVGSEDRVLVIDLDSYRITRSIPVGDAPVRPYATNDGAYLLVANELSRDFNVIDMLTLDVVTKIETGIAAQAINTGFFDTRAYVMPRDGGTMAVVDLMTLKQLDSIELPGPTDDGLVTSDMETLLAAIPSTGQIAQISVRQNKVQALINTGLEDVRGTKMGVVNAICH
ncbi:hypothetical protein R3X27_13030 [Tropicimonas sp. TH_r6]|uniref:YncE family protein n=1 Tax=Tropicimonas sp. TH_r6 TaxID=3082085 RepID=UPI0029549FF8|nr:hypothetical protein [Tropicimonas sp. TH_r6]MDV7143603.1 hypothetical protein [Tropicimonas sp. TH_r6]